MLPVRFAFESVDQTITLRVSMAFSIQNRTSTRSVQSSGAASSGAGDDQFLAAKEHGREPRRDAQEVNPSKTGSTRWPSDICSSGNLTDPSRNRTEQPSRCPAHLVAYPSQERLHPARTEERV
jgi:hypothetical protein